jgi:N-acetylglucosaminyl-diphospho-decaprenol L-rhamnosyltransferase
MPLAPTGFSAVVVSFYTGPVLDHCISALLIAPLCQQIVLVNNGNPPEVLARLARLGDKQSKLKIIDGHGNIGFGRACNLGSEHINQSKIVFINPDCIIDEGTLPALAEALTYQPRALVGGALRNQDGGEQRGCRRGELTLWSALISFLGLGREGKQAGIWRDFNRTKEPVPVDVVEMPVVSGALMAISATQFDVLGGFDPAYFLHVEDIDLCRRVRDRGDLVLFAPRATALHIGSTSDASSLAIESAKIASFGRYFLKAARTLIDFMSFGLVMPLVALAIIGRWFLSRIRGQHAPRLSR